MSNLKGFVNKWINDNIDGGWEGEIRLFNTDSIADDYNKTLINKEKRAILILNIKDILRIKGVV